MRTSSTNRAAILKKLRAYAKRFARVPVLATALLLSNSTTPAAEAAQPQKSINERVELIRSTLKRKVTTQQTSTNNLSYSERTLTQWGNWGNWGNWNNWLNWNNWNNWRNWGNWGNWGNV